MGLPDSCRGRQRLQVLVLTRRISKCAMTSVLRARAFRRPRTESGRQQRRTSCNRAISKVRLHLHAALAVLTYSLLSDGTFKIFTFKKIHIKKFTLKNFGSSPR